MAQKIVVFHGIVCIFSPKTFSIFAHSPFEGEHLFNAGHGQIVVIYSLAMIRIPTSEYKKKKSFPYKYTFFIYLPESCVFTRDFLSTSEGPLFTQSKTIRISFRCYLLAKLVFCGSIPASEILCLFDLHQNKFSGF